MKAYSCFHFLQVVKGIVDGCKQSDCVLLGGEVIDKFFCLFFHCI